MRPTTPSVMPADDLAVAIASLLAYSATRRAIFAEIRRENGDAWFRANGRYLDAKGVRG